MKYTSQNLKALFFEDIFLELAEYYDAARWFVFSGGGNINIRHDVILMIYCNGFTIQCELRSHNSRLYDLGMSSTIIINRENFDLNDPYCKEKILEWSKQKL